MAGLKPGQTNAGSFTKNDPRAVKAGRKKGSVNKINKEAKKAISKVLGTNFTVEKANAVLARLEKEAPDKWVSAIVSLMKFVVKPATQDTINNYNGELKIQITYSDDFEKLNALPENTVDAEYQIEEGEKNHE